MTAHFVKEKVQAVLLGSFRKTINRLKNGSASACLVKSSRQKKWQKYQLPFYQESHQDLLLLGLLRH